MAQHEETALARRGDAAPDPSRDFDFTDITVGFGVICTFGTGNLVAIAASVIGFIAQHQVRREPEKVTALARRAGDYATTAMAGMGVALPGLPALPAPREGSTMARLTALMPRLAAPAGDATTTTARSEPAQDGSRGATQAQAERRPRREPAVLTPEQFAEDPLFRTLNEEPHRLVIGHTQGGKSTTMHGMVQAWASRGHPVYVMDPDAANGSWPGATAIAGYAEDYAGIGAMVEELESIFAERSQDYAEGQREFSPIHIVADEVHETFAEVPGARKFLLDTLGRRGAKRGMLVTLGTQDQNKDSLGLDSAGVLNNFITTELAKDERGKRKAVVYRGNAARKSRVQEFNVPVLPGAKTFVRPRETAPAPASAPIVAATTTTTTNLRAPEPAADDLLAALLADQARQTISPERAARFNEIMAQQAARETSQMRQQPAQSVAVDRGEAGQVIVNVAQVAAPAHRPAARHGVNTRRMRERADKYREVKSLVAQGKSGNAIDQEVPGQRKKVLGMVREAKRELGM